MNKYEHRGRPEVDLRSTSGSPSFSVNRTPSAAQVYSSALLEDIAGSSGSLGGLAALLR